MRKLKLFIFSLSFFSIMLQFFLFGCSTTRHLYPGDKRNPYELSYIESCNFTIDGNWIDCPDTAFVLPGYHEAHCCDHIKYGTDSPNPVWRDVKYKKLCCEVSFNTEPGETYRLFPFQKWSKPLHLTGSSTRFFRYSGIIVKNITRDEIMTECRSHP